MVVWTGGQTTAFFTDATQMAIPAATIPFLVNEGIAGVADLSEFTLTDIFHIKYAVEGKQTAGT